MNNHKPTFAMVGKADDPKSKSSGGPFILLLHRTLDEENRAMFNFDPDTVYYRSVTMGQSDRSTITLRKESRHHFFRGHR